MKKILLSFGLILIVFFANAQQNKKETIAKLKSMELSWMNAFLEKDHGVKIMNEIIADDYFEIGPDGKMLIKSESIKALIESKDVTKSATQETMNVHFYGENVAVVMGKHYLKGISQNGKPFNRHFAWADTFMERNGKWQCISGCYNLIEEKK